MIASFLHDLFQSYRRMRRRRTTQRQLSALDDRMLRDIGLERGDIELLVNDLCAQTPSHDDARGAETPITEGSLQHLSGWITPRSV